MHCNTGCPCHNAQPRTHTRDGQQPVQLVDLFNLSIVWMTGSDWHWAKL